MNMRIPNNQDWGGIEPGRKGTVRRSFGIDFDEIEGRAVLSRPARVVSDSSVFNLKLVRGFLRSNADGTDRWYGNQQDSNVNYSDTTTASIIESTNVDPTSAWALDGTITSDDVRDMCTFGLDSNGIDQANAASAEEIMLITRDTIVASLNDSGANGYSATFSDDTTKVLTDTGINLIAGVPHPIINFDNLAVIGDRNVVHTIQKILPATSTGNYTYVGYTKRLQLPSEYEIQHIFRASNELWFPLANRRSDSSGGGKSGIAHWDGSASTFDLFITPGTRILSGVDWNGIPFGINDFGQILKWNGAGFAVDAEFPCVEEGMRLFDTDGGYAVVPRGMEADEDLIYINVGAVEFASTVSSKRTNSGIWAYNPRTKKLFNRYNLGAAGAIASSFRLAYNQQKFKSAGAIKFTNDPLTKMLMGVEVWSNYRTASRPLLCTFQSPLAGVSDSSVENQGFLETQPIASAEIQSRWNGAWSIHKRAKLTPGTNKIVLKSKGADYLRNSALINEAPFERRINWQTTTRFRMTMIDSSGGVGCPSVGDEVEVLAGPSSGTFLSAHISSITDTDSAAVAVVCPDTTTNRLITVDQSIGVADTTLFALARFERWRLMDSETDTMSSFKYYKDGTLSPYISYKVYMQGVWGDQELSELISDFTPETFIKK